MRIEWTEEIEFSDKSVEIIQYLAAAKNNMYTWYSNDHTGKHPFELHECRYLVENGFITKGRDYNFGDEYAYLTEKGRKLAKLIGGNQDER